MCVILTYPTIKFHSTNITRLPAYESIQWFNRLRATFEPVLYGGTEKKITTLRCLLFGLVIMVV